MNSTQKRLTTSQWKYLLTLKELYKSTGKDVRCKDIADALGFAKPSVHKMMSNMSQMGLIKKPLYGTVSITEQGEEFILKFLPYYTVLQGFFMSNFGFLESDARDGAVALIAEISEDSIFKMCEVLKVL
ncbi:MAG: metal-dependent transcriptional regulator [Ruminiclostridium sp.]